MKTAITKKVSVMIKNMRVITEKVVPKIMARKKIAILVSIGMLAIIGAVTYIFLSGDKEDTEYIIQYDINKETKKVAECMKCHTRGQSVIANDTIDRNVCYNCHKSGIEFMIPISSEAHKFHDGNSSILPSVDYLSRHKENPGNCDNCHVYNQERPTECKRCHELGSHVRTDKMCVSCHNLTSNLYRHRFIEIQTHDVFGNRSCDMCHSKDKIGLQLANGIPVPFTVASRLCRQCHFGVYESWSNKNHIDIVECTICHNPHSPKLNMSDLNITKISKEKSESTVASAIQRKQEKKKNRYNYYENQK